jgi:hypothetical protein
MDLVAPACSGGAGGSIVIQGNYEGDPIAAGRGGNAGSVHGSAGDGSPGCDGGRTEAFLGSPGANGKASGAGAKPAASGGQFGEIDLGGGGHGGDAKKASQDGGDGGDVKILLSGPRPKKKTDPKPNLGGSYYRHIELDRYANGGAGFDGCKATPKTPGTRGGDGGGLSIKRVVYTAQNSFNGAAGGSGSPAGSGGSAGRAANLPSTSESSFELGAPGLPCPSELAVYRAGPADEVGWGTPEGGSDRLKVESIQGCGKTFETTQFRIHYTDTRMLVNPPIPIVNQLIASGPIAQPFRFFTYRTDQGPGEVDVTLQGNAGATPTMTLKFLGSGSVAPIPNPSEQTLTVTVTPVTVCPAID